MAIVDVETPSGYAFSHHELADEFVSDRLVMSSNENCDPPLMCTHTYCYRLEPSWRDLKPEAQV